MWADFRAENPDAPPTCQSWHFCENQRDADELATLVLSGVKRATAGSVLEYDLANEPHPQVGDYSVVTNWAGEAQCVIRTTRIDTVAFHAVTAEFAATEGEGPGEQRGSLDYWRRVHWDYYTRVLAPFGAAPSEDMLILCERFDRVWPHRDSEYATEACPHSC